ncbi:hypothetical protein EDD21DRAFT_424147 [Dissophora ornata]|nr:hypothetical protein BGZ58_009249 [Dissophora ornata]KAI8603441.1 hypothetical protein EDD21DRAFT_424147 [Dissophora ornata]
MADEEFKPHILIVGAGLGGLSLAAILERGNISYEVYERASSVKPLGSAIALGPGVMPFFEQLGVLDRVMAKCKVLGLSYSWNEKLELQNNLSYAVSKEEFGYDGAIISRPALHDILLSLIPAEKIHFNKRVLSHVETGDGVLIRTADGETHRGNILVGADGAYSGVRQSLYGQLDKAKTLPKSDKEPLKFSSVCLVGQTTPLDPKMYPSVEDETCQFNGVIGDKDPYFWVTFTTADKTICWMAILVLNETSSKEHNTFRNSEWGPEAAESMAKDVRHYPIPCGQYKTLGDLIDLTPKDLMSKVMLEEKFFKSWYACHKMSPSAGLGASTAIHDAIVFANYLSTLKTNDPDDITNIFKQYQDERSQIAKEAVDTSARFTKMFGKTPYNAILRKLMTYAPKWFIDLSLLKLRRYRPQISFLPPPNDKGYRRPPYQRSLEKTRPKNFAAAVAV